jgi:hypothetical protein
MTSTQGAAVLFDERTRHPVDLLALPKFLAALTGIVCWSADRF